jgi:hypothetical protein
MAPWNGEVWLKLDELSISATLVTFGDVGQHGHGCAAYLVPQRKVLREQDRS